MHITLEEIYYKKTHNILIFRKKYALQTNNIT